VVSTIGDRLGGDDHPLDRALRAVDELDDARAKGVGVREEQRRIPAEQQEPGHLLRFRVALEVVRCGHSARS